MKVIPYYESYKAYTLKEEHSVQEAVLFCA